MRMKSVIALLVAMVFALGVVGLAFAAEKEMMGAITKMDAKSVTVKDAAGKETKMDVMCKDAKVGDKVTIKGGKCMKEAPKKKSSGY